MFVVLEAADSGVGDCKVADGLATVTGLFERAGCFGHGQVPVCATGKVYGHVFILPCPAADGRVGPGMDFAEGFTGC